MHHMAFTLSLNPGGPTFRLLPIPEEDSAFAAEHAAAAEVNRALVVRLTEARQLFLVPIQSIEEDGHKSAVFWGFVTAPGVPVLTTELLDRAQLALILDLDETLLVANSYDSISKRRESCIRAREAIAVELARPDLRLEDRESKQNLSTALQMEEELLARDADLLQQFITSPNSCIKVNGQMHTPRMETALREDGTTVQRPIIRLNLNRQFSNVVLTRIDPLNRNTSMLLRIRPGWEDLRRYLAGDFDGKQRFQVYVCTAAERQYALEVWRLLDMPQQPAAAGNTPSNLLIPQDKRRERIVNVTKERKTILNTMGLLNGMLAAATADHVSALPLAVVVDDRLEVWADSDQDSVLQVMPWLYYKDEAHSITRTHLANAMYSENELARVRNAIVAIRGEIYMSLDKEIKPHLDMITAQGIPEAEQRDNMDKLLKPMATAPNVIQGVSWAYGMPRPSSASPPPDGTFGPNNPVYAPPQPIAAPAPPVTAPAATTAPSLKPKDPRAARAAQMKAARAGSKNDLIAAAQSPPVTVVQPAPPAAPEIKVAAPAIKDLSVWSLDNMTIEDSEVGTAASNAAVVNSTAPTPQQPAGMPQAVQQVQLQAQQPTTQQTPIQQQPQQGTPDILNPIQMLCKYHEAGMLTEKLPEIDQLMAKYPEPLQCIGVKIAKFIVGNSCAADDACLLWEALENNGSADAITTAAEFINTHGVTAVRSLATSLREANHGQAPPQAGVQQSLGLMAMDTGPPNPNRGMKRGAMAIDDTNGANNASKRSRNQHPNVVGGQHLEFPGEFLTSHSNPLAGPPYAPYGNQEFTPQGRRVMPSTALAQALSRVAQHITSQPAAAPPEVAQVPELPAPLQSLMAAGLLGPPPNDVQAIQQHMQQIQAAMQQLEQQQQQQQQQQSTQNQPKGNVLATPPHHAVFEHQNASPTQTLPHQVQLPTVQQQQQQQQLPPPEQQQQAAAAQLLQEMQQLPAGLLQILEPILLSLLQTPGLDISQLPPLPQLLIELQAMLPADVLQQLQAAAAAGNINQPTPPPQQISLPPPPSQPQQQQQPPSNPTPPPFAQQSPAPQSFGPPGGLPFPPPIPPMQQQQPQQQQQQPFPGALPNQLQPPTAMQQSLTGVANMPFPQPPQFPPRPIPGPAPPPGEPPSSSSQQASNAPGPNQFNQPSSQGGSSAPVSKPSIPAPAPPPGPHAPHNMQQQQLQANNTQNVNQPPQIPKPAPPPGPPPPSAQAMPPFSGQGQQQLPPGPPLQPQGSSMQVDGMGMVQQGQQVHGQNQQIQAPPTIPPPRPPPGPPPPNVGGNANAVMTVPQTSLLVSGNRAVDMLNRTANSRCISLQFKEERLTDPPRWLCKVVWGGQMVGTASAPVKADAKRLAATAACAKLNLEPGSAVNEKAMTQDPIELLKAACPGGYVQKDLGRVAQNGITLRAMELTIKHNGQELHATGHADSKPAAMRIAARQLLNMIGQAPQFASQQPLSQTSEPGGAVSDKGQQPDRESSPVSDVFDVDTGMDTSDDDGQQSKDGTKPDKPKRIKRTNLVADDDLLALRRSNVISQMEYATLLAVLHHYKLAGVPEKHHVKMAALQHYVQNVQKFTKDGGQLRYAMKQYLIGQGVVPNKQTPAPGGQPPPVSKTGPADGQQQPRHPLAQLQPQSGGTMGQPGGTPMPQQQHMFGGILGPAPPPGPPPGQVNQSAGAPGPPGASTTPQPPWMPFPGPQPPPGAPAPPPGGSAGPRPPGPRPPAFPPPPNIQSQGIPGPQPPKGPPPPGVMPQGPGMQGMMAPQGFPQGQMGAGMMPGQQGMPMMGPGQLPGPRPPPGPPPAHIVGTPGKPAPPPHPPPMHMQLGMGQPPGMQQQGGLNAASLEAVVQAQVEARLKELMKQQGLSVEDTRRGKWEHRGRDRRAPLYSSHTEESGEADSKDGMRDKKGDWRSKDRDGEASAMPKSRGLVQAAKQRLAEAQQQQMRQQFAAFKRSSGEAENSADTQNMWLAWQKQYKQMLENMGYDMSEYVEDYGEGEEDESSYQYDPKAYMRNWQRYMTGDEEDSEERPSKPHKRGSPDYGESSKGGSGGGSEQQQDASMAEQVKPAMETTVAAPVASATTTAGATSEDDESEEGELREEGEVE